MYKCIGTGKNENYGKKDEIKYVSDWHTSTALKQGWIKPNPIFLGKQKPYTKYMIEISIKAIKRDIKFLTEKLKWYEKENKNMRKRVIKNV